MAASFASRRGNFEFVGSMKKNWQPEQAGQVVVEYVLLLVVAVALATIVVVQVVQRDPDNLGFLIQKWSDIQKAIGADDPGKKTN